MHTLLWFIYFWLYLLVLLPLLRRARALTKRGDTAAHDALTRRTVGRWARRLIAAAGGRVTVEGLEHLPAGPVVCVGNHQGYFDIPLTLGYLGEAKPLVAKKEIQKIPLIRAWMAELHCVFLDRENPRAAVASLDEAAALVAAGYSMVVFPEGTRSRGGEMGEFKGGAFKIAQKARVPVVPFVIEGTADLMEKHHYFIHGGRIRLRVLPAIDTSAYERADWRALPALCEAQVRAQLAQMRAENAEKRP